VGRAARAPPHEQVCCRSLADGTPDIPDEDLIPSLLTTSDVFGTGWFAAIANVQPGMTVAVVGVPHGVNLPADELFSSHVALWGGPAPVRRFLPDLIDLVYKNGINPGKVFDLMWPLEQVAPAIAPWTNGARSRRSCDHRPHSMGWPRPGGSQIQNAARVAP
jgi:threonine dehydrogenase-like Zn-dependent dehydrogenase